MRTYEPFDEPAIQALLENLPMSNTTPNPLRNKLVELAASPQPRHRAVRRPVYAFAFAGVLTVVAVAMMVSIPATAKSWAGIMKAVQGVTSMQMEIRELDGKRETTRVAFAPGVILVEPPEGQIVYIANGTVQVYDPKEKVVREFPMPGGMMPDVAKEVMGSISMSNILAEHEKEFGKGNVKIGPSRVWQGRRVYDAVFTKPASQKDNEDDEVRIVVDEASDLPVSIESFKLRNGKLVKTNEIIARYNAQLTADQLKPKFPPGVRIEKFDISKFMDGKGEPPEFDFDEDED